MSEYFLLFLCTIAFGSVIGAYFGTADYRIRNDEPLVTRQCRCPKCRHILPTVHQIPIASWIFLKGRCRYCHAAIPKSYPMIEGGFLLFYGITFLFLWSDPGILVCLWILFIAVILLFRCQGHFRSMIKGLLIFTGYNLLYGTLLLILHMALAG